MTDLLGDSGLGGQVSDLFGLLDLFGRLRSVLGGTISSATVLSGTEITYRKSSLD